jgi:2-octaprenyl-6-methoxyphenol hydroxylase
VTHDVVIVGAGPVGATLALGLRETDLDVVVVDGRRPDAPSRTDRSLALSHGARLILERLRVWTALAAMPGAMTPIFAIDISQARGFGAVRLEADEQGLPALGYVASYQALQKALDDAMVDAGIRVRFGAPANAVDGTAEAATVEIGGQPDTPLRARLAIVADGAASSVRGVERKRHDYRQVAVVAHVSLDHPHRGVAFERFTRNGPIALLPEGDRYGLVWTQTPDAAQRTLALGDAAFLHELADHFGSRVGRFVRVGERRSFPLALEIARNTTVDRVAVIGNAAQALHPIAGQGFNLGLRDAFELASIIVDTPRSEIGAPRMLARYRAGRAGDRRAGIAFTHGLVRLFGNDRPWLSVPRGVGMMMLDALPIAKRTFTRAMLFGLR